MSANMKSLDNLKVLIYNAEVQFYNIELILKKIFGILLELLQ